MSTLAPYRAIFGARFRMLLQYRAAALAGLWTQIVFGMVLIMIYEAFYASSSAEARPLALSQVVTYVWVGQALFAMLPINVDSELRTLIRTGSIAYELCRPVDLYAWWYARACALRTAPALLRALPMFVFAMLLLPVLGLDEWQLVPPAPERALGYIASLVCAILLASAITALTAATAS
jgi:ABC-2 type transport system permease protein